jgi:hypothetical protein
MTKWYLYQDGEKARVRRVFSNRASAEQELKRLEKIEGGKFFVREVQDGL